MPLTKPPLAPADPGQPITAQAWNVIVDGLDDLFDAVLSIGTGVAEISVVFDGNPVSSARVIAQPLGEGNPVAALPPFGGRTTHGLFGVNPGNWRIHITAPGFNPEIREVELPLADPLVVDLVRAGSVMPDLFGLGAEEALQQLEAQDLNLDLVLDTTGVEVSHRDLPADYQNSEVLVQQPAAGAVVDPVAQRVRLVVAAALRQQPTVTMPSLIGLTQDEAAEVLAGLGLRIGRTTVTES